MGAEGCFDITFFSKKLGLSIADITVHLKYTFPDNIVKYAPLYIMRSSEVCVYQLYLI